MVRRILVPLDGSALAERVLPHASALARAFEAPLVLLQVLAAERRVGRVPVDSAEWRLRRREAAAYLEVLASRLQEAGLEAASAVAEGNVEEQILAEVAARQADLIVLSTHGRSGASEVGLGGSAAKLLTRAGVSVLIVRAAAETALPQAGATLRYRRIVAAVDGSHRSDWALHLAVRVARSSEAELVIAHVVRIPTLLRRGPASPEEAQMVERIVQSNRAAAEEYVDELAAKLAAPDLPVRSAVILSEQVAQSLDELGRQEGADLLVVSAHGAAGASSWPYGAVAGMLVAYGTTPLLIFQDRALTAGEESASTAGAAALSGDGWSP